MPKFWVDKVEEMDYNDVWLYSCFSMEQMKNIEEQVLEHQSLIKNDNSVMDKAVR